MTTTAKVENLYLSVNQVAKRYGVSSDTIWRWKREGMFPAPVRIGPNCTRWRLSDLNTHDSTLQTCFATHAAFFDAA
jgi:prophage regulatory protein